MKQLYPISGILLTLGLLTACYSSTNIEGDVTQDDGTGDPNIVNDAQDDDQFPDMPCLQPIVPEFEELEYSETVPADTPFMLVIYHEPAILPGGTCRLDGDTVLVTLDGLACTCDPCPYDLPESLVTSLNVDGLTAGEYFIDIQGKRFPLHVVGDCDRYPLEWMWDGDTLCPEEVRINEQAHIAFTGMGHSCDCGGYTETNAVIEHPDPPDWGELWIKADEVICDPEQCCDDCRCVDMYDVDMDILFPGEGMFTVHVNDAWMCMIAVFGESGCSHRAARWVEVVEYTPVVLIPPDGETPDAVFDLSVSSGMCCSPEPIVVITGQVRDDASHTVTLKPSINMCEGDCCYTCECMDSFPTTIRIANLTAGVWNVCISGDECYPVEVFEADY